MLAEMKCENCNAWMPNKDHQVKKGGLAQQQGWCRAKPPIVISLMMPGPMGPQGPTMVPAQQGAFPPVTADWWCREWQPHWQNNARAVMPALEHEGSNDHQRPAA
jgi:hypothetical protein